MPTTTINPSLLEVNNNEQQTDEQILATIRNHFDSLKKACTTGDFSSHFGEDRIDEIQDIYSPSAQIAFRIYFGNAEENNNQRRGIEIIMVGDSEAEERIYLRHNTDYSLSTQRSSILTTFSPTHISFAGEIGRSPYFPAIEEGDYEFKIGASTTDPSKVEYTAKTRLNMIQPKSDDVLEITQHGGINEHSLSFKNKHYDIWSEKPSVSSATYKHIEDQGWYEIEATRQGQNIMKNEANKCLKTVLTKDGSEIITHVELDQAFVEMITGEESCPIAFDVLTPNLISSSSINRIVNTKFANPQGIINSIDENAKAYRDKNVPNLDKFGLSDDVPTFTW